MTVLLICSGPLASTGQTFTFAVNKASRIKGEYERQCARIGAWMTDVTVHEWSSFDGKWTLQDTYQWR